MKKAVLLICLLAGTATAQNRLPAGMRPPGCTAGLQLPEGFCATVFADGIRGARHLVLAPNGDVFINVQGDAATAGVVALRDTNRDGVADVRQRFGSGGGSGIALDGNTLYATAGSSIVRYRINPGSLTPAGRPDTVVTALPMAGPHHAHNFVLQNRTLFVNIGSATNACQQRDRVAGSLGNNPCHHFPFHRGGGEPDHCAPRQCRCNTRADTDH